MSVSPPSRPSVYLETFGCQMNELDSELVTGALRGLGYEFTSEREAAEVVLYNTCSVREHAEQKVWSRLGEDKLRKVDRPGMVIGVLGCMAERDGKDLIRRMPQVDILCGPGELDKLPALVDNAVRTRRAMVDTEAAWRASHQATSTEAPWKKLKSAGEVALQGNTSRRSATLAAAEDTLELLDLSRSVSAVTHSGSAYVRITRGCNKFCTYCVVPFTRGAEMHRPPDHIIEECKRLADAGVVEITLLGQTVNHYRFEHGSAVTLGGVVQPQKGRSYKGGHRADPFRGENVTTFADLLARIHEEVPEIQRLRFVTSYPRDFGDDVLQVIRDHPRICRYLHVPAQSGSNRILEMMNRGYTVEEYDEFVVRAREYLHQPEIGRPLSVAGDIIVGFPTETEEDFAKTVAMVERSRYKNCFIFKYSPRPGTIAYDKLVDDVPEDVKRRRNNELLAVQNRVGEEVMREYRGVTLDVFVEGLSVHEQKRRAGKTVGEHAHGHGHSHAGGGKGGISLTIGGKSLNGDAGGSNGSACSVEGSHVYGAMAAVADEAAGTPLLQLSARTEGDVIVHIDTANTEESRRLVGKVVTVKIVETKALALRGELHMQASGVGRGASVSWQIETPKPCLGYTPRMTASRVSKKTVLPDARVSPRFAGVCTFCRYPRIEDVTPENGPVDWAIYGVPFDSGVTYRPGTRFGPRAIREASQYVKRYSIEHDVDACGVLSLADAGDSPVRPFSCKEMSETQLVFARGLGDAKTTKLMAIGGDHSIAYANIKATWERRGRPSGGLALMHFDSHLDTVDQTLGEKWSHASPFIRAIEDGIVNPKKMLSIGIKGPLNTGDDLRFARDHGVTVVTYEQWRREGANGTRLEEFVRNLGGEECYLTFDIDCIDPAFAPGTGTPSIGGFTSAEALGLLRSLKGLNVVGADVVEVLPDRDVAGITALLAGHVMFEVLCLDAVNRRGA